GERPGDAGAQIGDAAELRRVEVLGLVLVRVDRDVRPVVEIDHGNPEARLFEDFMIASHLQAAEVAEKDLASSGRPDETGIGIAAALGESGRRLDDLLEPGPRDVVDGVWERRGRRRE